VPTATDEPSEESARQDGAAASDSLNGAGAAESPNGVHGDQDATVTSGYDDPATQPEPAAEAPVASVFDPRPGPGVPAAAPETPAASIFVPGPSQPASTDSMFTDVGPPLPAAVGVPAGEESPAPADDPSSAYQPGPTAYSSVPDDGYSSGYESGYSSGYDPGYAAGYDPGYAPEYAAETGYNQGMTQPVGEEAAAPPPAYPADLPASSAKSGGAKSSFTSAYRSLPRRKSRTRAGGEVAPARRANLVIARLEPWSVMKFSFLMSLVAWVVLFVAVALLYYALSHLGVFTSIQRTLASVTSSTSSSGVNLTKWTSASRVLGYTMLIGAVDVVLITALATIGAMVYNLVTHLGGGIEVTLKETD
jgi:hypothetical protein